MADYSNKLFRKGSLWYSSEDLKRLELDTGPEAKERLHRSKLRLGEIAITIAPPKFPASMRPIVSEMVQAIQKTYIKSGKSSWLIQLYPSSEPWPFYFEIYADCPHSRSVARHLTARLRKVLGVKWAINTWDHYSKQTRHDRCLLVSGTGTGPKNG